ncbi:MAG: hypothetical protein ACYTGZ_19310, partial [Planctomycetota bacterium]
ASKGGMAVVDSAACAQSTVSSASLNSAYTNRVPPSTSVLAAVSSACSESSFSVIARSFFCAAS